MPKVIYPIAFGIDETKIVSSAPKDKDRAFASLIPGDMSTYVFTNEHDYMTHYSKSFYAFTWVKGGWDCMRHYEIIAAGCMPFFVNLEGCPPNTMHNFPRDIIFQAMALPGVDHHSRTIDFNVFPIDKYYTLLNQLLEYARTHLTTRTMAEYVLERCGFDYKNDTTSKVVFINCRLPDYQSHMLLQGLKRTIGKRCVGIPNDYYMYDDFTEEEAYRMPQSKGFNYTRLLPRELKTTQEEYDATLQDPKDVKIVIFGKCHWDNVPPPSLEQPHIQKVFICGEDLHSCHFMNDPDQSYILFVREM